MSGLRRMLMNKKGGFYIKSVDVTALPGNGYLYYIDIELSQELVTSGSGGISSLSVYIQLGPFPNWGSYTMTRQVTAEGHMGGTTYRVPVFKADTKYTYCTLTVTPKRGDTALAALPAFVAEVG